MSFMNAKRTVGNVGEFINKINEVPKNFKYVSEPNAKHKLYFPVVKTVTVVDGVEKESYGLKAMVIPIHNVTTIDGKYRGTYCTKDTTDANGNLVRCPYCENVSKAWDVVNYLREREEANCKILDPTEREKYLNDKKKEIISGLKLNRPVNRVYVIVAQYQLNGKNQPVIDADTKLPLFELKVMSLSEKRLQQLQEIAIDAEYEGLEGAEFTFTYDDKEMRYRKATSVATHPDSRIINKYSGLREAIDAEVEKFDEECLSKTFSELRDVPVEEKQAIVDALFASWDSFVETRKSDETAVYLESKSVAPVNVTPAKSAPELAVDTDELFRADSIGGSISL